MQDHIERSFLSLREAAEQFPVSKRYLWGLIHSGKLQGFRLGKKLILKREDVERLLTATPVSTDVDTTVNDVMHELDERGQL